MERKYKTAAQLAHAVWIKARNYATAKRMGRSLGRVREELHAAVKKLEDFEQPS